MKAFNGDRRILSVISDLCARYDIERAVETGTHTGHTTRMLSELVSTVYTMDVMDYPRVACANVHQFTGESEEVLPRILGGTFDNTLFYLDAHFPPQSTAVRSELQVIAQWMDSARQQSKSPAAVIAIHDFLVPGSTLGYDTYNGRTLDWDFVSDLVIAIYGANGYHRFCNSEAEGARRGVLYVRPILP